MKKALPYLLVTISTVSYAQLPPDAIASSEPQYGHVYLGGRIGWSALQGACSNDALNCDNDSVGYGIYGGYQLNSWLALEGGITHYGSPSARYAADKVSMDIYGGEVAVKFNVPVTERLDVLTRLGGAYQHIDKTLSSPPDAIESSEWNVLSSIGLSYRLSQRWSMRGEYQFIDGIGDADVGQADAHLTTMGLTYHFGQSSSVTTPVTETVLAPPRETLVETKLHLDAQSLFEFDSATFSSSPSLNAMIEQLLTHSEGNIRVVGHTDDLGPEEYNQHLSEQRAQAVAQYLEQQGIDAARLVVLGLGESAPMAPNDTEEGRAQNRRVEVLFDTQVTEYEPNSDPDTYSDEN
ncbi:hypothetical protein CGK40_22995 [Vibrio parahaemolyticus]|uniref:OmpA family protein n=1 Tax=Vibrio parahaemolyticus TaxID=670 RepID=UPI00111D5A8B|nr:porin [Vibrio parahaemolyticus]TNZ87817.1 hypothetical protein CGK40_22995 [Vibrio parahaemolyticus]